MDALVMLGVGFGMLVAGCVAHRAMIARRQASLRALALSAGLTELSVVGVSWLAARVTAAAGRLRVVLQDSVGEKQRSTTITVFDRDDGMQGLSLAPETSSTEIQKDLLGVREIEIGDGPFDAEFFIGGQPSKARALLDAKTRGILRTITPAAHVQLAHGRLWAVSPSGLMRGGIASLAPLLASLLEAAQRMTSGPDTAARLAHNARADPLAAVRLQNLLVLLREFWGPSTRETLRVACHDGSPEIRLRAADGLGSEGLPVLLQLAADWKIDDIWQAEAVKVLGRRLSFEQAQAFLTESLRSRRTLTAAACLHTLGTHGLTAVAVLQRVLAVETDALACAAARALGMTRVSAAEPALLAALEHDGDETRCAAAEALGHVGTAEAVLPLKEAADRYPRDRALSRATRQAVAEIHSRLAGATPGQLSLATADAGQVSLAETEAGQLSFPRSETGQLSLPAVEAGQLALHDARRVDPEPNARDRRQR